MFVPPESLRKKSCSKLWKLVALIQSIVTHSCIDILNSPQRWTFCKETYAYRYNCLLARYLGQGDGKGCQLPLVILFMLSTTSFIFPNFLSTSSHLPQAFPHFNNLTVALQRWCMNIYLCFWEEQLDQNFSLGCINLRAASLVDGEEYCREPNTTRFAGSSCPAHK